MELKITTLIENNPDDKGQLLYEHGLSLYIETDRKNILFDTGESGDFIKNAKSLHKNLDKLDYCIISHGHYDHSGGVEKFISEVDKVPQFIVGEEFFKPKYKTADAPGYKFNGNSFDEEFIAKKQISLRKVKEDMIYLTDHIIVFHHFSRYTDYEVRNSRFFIKENDEFTPDNFDDEISMGIITEKGLVVIVGCSHVGIVNILKTISKRVNIPIHAVIGGTHLIEADEFRMKKTMAAFKDMKIQLIAVSHCTGKEGIRLISEELKEQFLYNNTGKVIEI
ncbi:MBL fold metallo-hydrolase [Lacrimispora sp.]|jgi:7,8-dihydropterin-6-yl-methyl-4-(beta-D-ribofuranosyl)aminobenzene 5'-phosphate synthase|uniref:MBL fold metallo-hydrolase n=1 Tax=Lacrimispora sp. TaxID=2719234 RepID=UPI0029E2D63D|nr:7,8-dihydropterin-6-yl-methyl-4-(beta-D-ribofuranosyl)aminobenzene 5-phosphate synthase [Lacrimispora sp.]